MTNMMTLKRLLMSWQKNGLRIRPNTHISGVMANKPLEEKVFILTTVLVMLLGEVTHQKELSR